ncbi:MAG TPA: type II toxin-antitoxin system VapC family toxin [Coriobacteriia bacterium]
MTVRGVVVLDASVGVKWFRHEAGERRAMAVLESALRGETQVVVPTHFAHEVLSVIERRNDTGSIVDAWQLMLKARVEIVPLTDAVVREAAKQCDRLDCSFYDALAPAVASLLEATLISADFKAHALYPGVELIG